MNEELRAFFFGNFYLSSIQQGIQAGHTIADMFVKYDNDSFEYDMLWSWAKNHKTMVLLNGGMGRDLTDLQCILRDCPLPWAYFKEDFDALNNANTCVGIILPESIYSKVIYDGGRHDIVEVGEDNYNVVDGIRDELVYENMTKWELDFVNYKSKCRLAQ